MNKLLKKQGSNIFFGVIVIVLAIMPLLLSAGVLNSSTVLFLGKCIAFSIVAMGLDLIWGYTGILSLGHGLYFALGGYAMAMYLKLQQTGGGITEIKTIFGSIKGNANQGNMFKLFYLALLFMIIIYAISKFLVNRKFGKLLIAIRDGENRTYFSGYKVDAYKTFIYVLSAVFAGIAGAIFVNFNGSITPSQMTISYSITMVIWVAVGGRGTIIGAVIGAFLINLCEYNLSSGSMVEIWQYIIGAVFCVTILFFKGGIVGIVTDQLPSLIRKIKGKSLESAEKSLNAHDLKEVSKS